MNFRRGGGSTLSSQALVQGLVPESVELERTDVLNWRTESVRLWASGFPNVLIPSRMARYAQDTCL